MVESVMSPVGELFITEWGGSSFDVNLLLHGFLWYTWVPVYGAFVLDENYIRDSFFDRDFTHTPISVEAGLRLLRREDGAVFWPIRYLDLYEKPHVAGSEVLLSDFIASTQVVEETSVAE